MDRVREARGEKAGGFSGNLARPAHRSVQVNRLIGAETQQKKLEGSSYEKIDSLGRSPYSLTAAGELKCRCGEARLIFFF